jgi:hypothetical protein
MSGKGNCFDNAVAGSFFSTLKNDLTHHRSFPTHGEAQAAIFDFIEIFYNLQRLHQHWAIAPSVEVEALLINLSTKSETCRPDPRPDSPSLSSRWRQPGIVPRNMPQPAPSRGQVMQHEDYLVGA